MKTVHEVVNGPRPHDLSRVERIERALTIDVVFAREAALMGDAEGEAAYHESINELLATREEALADEVTSA